MKLDSEKMGDVIIKSTKDNAEIFHANKKRLRDFSRLQRLKAKKEADGGDALSLHTAGQTYTGANGVSNTLSSANPPFGSNIIPQDSNQNQTKSRQKQIADMKERVKNAVNKSALSPQIPNKEMER